MRRALVLGAGGHCRVVLSLLTQCHSHDVIGVLDLNQYSAGEHIMNVPILGTASNSDLFCGREDTDFFLAIGDNHIRYTWWRKAKESNLSLPNLISPDSLIDSSAEIGESNIVCARAFIGALAVLGDNNLINTAAIVEHEVRIGSGCHLAPASLIAGRSQIGNSCFIGANATIINGIGIQSNVTVGAGAVVVKDIVTESCTYVGVPARQSGR